MQLNQDIQVRSNEAQRESRKKDKLERELKQSKADLDAKNSEIKSLTAQIEKHKAENQRLEQSLKEQRVRCLSNLLVNGVASALAWEFWNYVEVQENGPLVPVRLSVILNPCAYVLESSVLSVM